MFPASGEYPCCVERFRTSVERDVNLIAEFDVGNYNGRRAVFVHAYFETCPPSHAPLNPYYRSGYTRGDVYVSADIEGLDWDRVWARRCHILDYIHLDSVMLLLERRAWHDLQAYACGDIPFHVSRVPMGHALMGR